MSGLYIIKTETGVLQTVNTKELLQRSRYYQSMLDLQLIDTGQNYKELKKSYIIFICLQDIFEQGRHRYTFKNLCREDKNLKLGDGTTKIFLNAKGTLNDVSQRLKAFLDYVAGKKTEDAYIEELDRVLEDARNNREWRNECMTLLRRDQGKRKSIKELL